MDVSQLMASATLVINALKRAREVTKRADDAAIQSLLLDAQEAALSLKEELLNLRTENLELRERLAVQDTLTFDRGAYWREGDPREGPFCSRCFEADRKAIRLTPGYDYSHSCPECDKVFEVLSAPKGRSYQPPRITLG